MTSLRIQNIHRLSAGIIRLVSSRTCLFGGHGVLGIDSRNTQFTKPTTDYHPEAWKGIGMR